MQIHAHETIEESSDSFSALIRLTSEHSSGGGGSKINQTAHVDADSKLLAPKLRRAELLFSVSHGGITQQRRLSAGAPSLMIDERTNERTNDDDDVRAQCGHISA